MPSASITSTILGIPVVGASRNDAVMGSIVTLASTNVHTTYSWTLAYKPPGSAATFSGSAVAASPGTFTVDKEGPYLIRLTADLGLGTETTQYIRVRYPTVFGALDLVAAGEGYGGAIPVPVDQTPTGWTDTLNTNLLTLLGLVSQGAFSGNMYTVDPTDGYGDFQTIQGAIDASIVAGAASGNPFVVLVRPGIYTEDVTFKANVYVYGWPGSTAEIVGFPVVLVRGVHTAEPTNVGDSVVLGQLTLANINASVNSTLQKLGAGSLTLHECVIEQNGLGVTQGPALRVDAGTVIAVESGFVAVSTLADDRAAIWQTSTSTMTLERCYVRGPTGMVLNDSASALTTTVLNDTTVTSSGATGYAILSDATDLIIDRSRVSATNAVSITIHPSAGAFATDQIVTIRYSVIAGTIEFDATGIVGASELTFGASEFGTISFPGLPPATIGADTQAATIFYDNTASGMAAAQVQQALDEVYAQAILVRTLDDAYDGGVTNSGLGRIIVADQGSVRISDAPIASDPPEAGATNGRLEVVSSVRIGAIDAPEISLDPNPYGSGAAIVMGNRVVPNNHPWSAGTTMVMANSTGSPLFRNYDLRVQTQSTLGGGTLGRLILQGGDGLPNGVTTPDASSVFLQAGSAFDATAVPGNVFISYGSRTGGASGSLILVRPEGSTAATLTAAGACADPIGVDGTITFATNMGAVTLTVAAVDTRAAVIANLSALDGISAVDSGGGVIQITTDHLGENAEIYFLTATAGVDAAIGGFDGQVQVDGTFGEYMDVQVSADQEVSLGVTGAVGPLIYNADTGKLTVPGIIDPTAIVFEEAGAPGTGPTEGAVFVSDGSGGLTLGSLYYQGPGSSTPIDLFLASSLKVNYLTGSTYSTLQDYIDVTGSAGFVSGGAISDAGGATIDVAAGTGFIRDVSGETESLYFFDWPASLGLAIPNDATRWVGVRYNGGTPEVYLNTGDLWDDHLNFPIGVVFNEGGTLYISLYTQDVGNAVTKINNRFDATSHIARDAYRGGLALGESADGNRYVEVSGGKLWYRLDTYTVNDINTAIASTFDRFYQDGGGGWTKQSAQTTWNNTQYDDGTGVLATIAAGQYAVQWFYVDLLGNLTCLFGRATYATAELAANEPTPPTAPDRLAYGSLLVGRIIFQESAGVASSVDSAFVLAFASSLVASHGSLSGLGSDDHTQYALLAGSAIRNVVSGTFDIGTGVLLLPVAAVPAQTLEGSAVWDSNDDLLTVGTGAGRKTMVDTDSTQSLSNKTLLIPTFTRDDASTNTVLDVATISRTTSGIAAANIGAALLFQVENGTGATVDAARISAFLENVGAGTEASNIGFSTRTAGGALTSRWVIEDSGGFVPSTDNAVTLGDAAHRISVLHGVSFEVRNGAGDVAAIYGMDNLGVHGGVGGASLPDVNLTRITGPLWNMDVGLRVGGNVTRHEGAITFGTTRTNAGGSTDTVTVQAAAAVASAGSAQAGSTANLFGSNAAATGPGNFSAAGGAVNLTAGNSAAVNVAQANGTSVIITGGNAATGVGGAAAKGGGVSLVGVAGTGGGDGGDILIQVGPLDGGGADGSVTFSVNGAARSPSLLPRATNEGAIGTASVRWATVAFRDEDSSGQKKVGFVSKVSVDSPYPIQVSDYVVLYDPTGGNSTVDLPAAASSTNRVLIIKHSSSSGNTVTIDGSGAETIDGNLTVVLSSLQSVTIICNGTAWLIL